MNSKLPVHEWWAVFFFASMLFVVGITTYFRAEPVNIKISDQIQIHCTGEVDHPGYHFVAPGTTLHELLPRVAPYSDSEPVGFSFSDVLKEGDKVRFKSTLVKVRIKGAVKRPVTLSLKKGALLRDSLEAIELCEDADVSKVQHREIKRNHQTITIPRQKSKNK